MFKQIQRGGNKVSKLIPKEWEMKQFEMRRQQDACEQQEEYAY
jgi:hypothetical protein